MGRCPTWKGLLRGWRVRYRQPGAASRYSLASVTLHWLMLALLVAVYAFIELREVFPKATEAREAMKMWHFMVGLSVFVLVWVRVAARLIWPSPAPATEAPRWRHLASRATHLALYLFMIAMPLAGWIILSAEGKAVPFFGFELPALTSENEAVAARVEALHKLGGTLGYWLIGVHAAASLLHHYVLRDGLLSRMLPART